jgi:hypothetical protein
MSLMTKRSFRHWQKSSKKSITKITKQHMAIVIITTITINKKCQSFWWWFIYAPIIYHINLLVLKGTFRSLILHLLSFSLQSYICSIYDTHQRHLIVGLEWRRAIIECWWFLSVMVDNTPSFSMPLQWKKGNGSHFAMRWTDQIGGRSLMRCF